MKTIEVVAAIIKKDDKIFITKRSYGEFIDMWEFPGGKVEVGETQEEALIREIKEYCRKRKIVFSQVVVEQLRKWHEEQTNEE